MSALIETASHRLAAGPRQPARPAPTLGTATPTLGWVPGHRRDNLVFADDTVLLPGPGIILDLTGLPAVRKTWTDRQRGLPVVEFRALGHASGTSLLMLNVRRCRNDQEAVAFASGSWRDDDVKVVLNPEDHLDLLLAMLHGTVLYLEQGGIDPEKGAWFHHNTVPLIFPYDPEDLAGPVIETLDGLGRP